MSTVPITFRLFFTGSRHHPPEVPPFLALSTLFSSPPAQMSPRELLMPLPIFQLMPGIILDYPPVLSAIGFFFARSVKAWVSSSQSWFLFHRFSPTLRALRMWQIQSLNDPFVFQDFSSDFLTILLPTHRSSRCFMDFC